MGLLELSTREPQRRALARPSLAARPARHYRLPPNRGNKDEAEKREALGLLDELAGEVKGAGGDEVRRVRQEFEKQPSTLRRDLLASVHTALMSTRGAVLPAARRLVACRPNMASCG